ncbi:hypothetical protein V8Z79_15310 [Pantoea dispersa]|uniref:hypothetical protein n=1 Tax=Pantoea dispersa TaxID=59814 RepID=UPI0007375A02|nr:hypothetical protein [Pantoea dispersa]KTS17798.1 hypothetical protein NS215_06555 [Pantoea dispersa]KTS89441.1 hypothetical protein RSA31_00255 [Pantoea dispersa]
MKVKIDGSVLKHSPSKEFFFDCMSAHRINHSIDSSNISNLLDEFDEDSVVTEKLKRLAVISANQDFHLSITITQNGCSNTHSISNLNEILSRKAVIILENEFSDAGFLGAVLKAKGKEWLFNLKDISWEIKGTGGCGQIPRAIVSEVKKSHGILRLFVIHDSDKLFPGSDYSVAQKAIIQTARNNNVYCHTLLKREIENYIPDIMISNIDVTRARMVRNLDKLSSIQKDYFDYKIGFKKKGGYRKKDDALYNGLFESIDDDVYESLKDGFGKDIAEKIFFDGCQINLDVFSKRCANIDKEFNDICEVIEKIL